MESLHLSRPLTLKCGLTIPNRLVKSALTEKFATKDSLPASKQCLSAYEEWADGGWGMVITGNVQVTPKYLGAKGDIAFDPARKNEDKVLQAWKQWAAACSKNGTKAIVQINHPGRQSPAGAGCRGPFTKNIAPSPVPLDFGDGLLPKIIGSVMFGTPREMAVAEIEDIVRHFASTARLAADAGFAGVQIHGAHGYLLTQFLSPKTNRRLDDYGGSAVKRAKIVVDIIHAVRAVVPSGFCVGIKLNSADFQSVYDMKDFNEQLGAITAAGVDFVEVSGGTYENPEMMANSAVAEKSTRTKAREAFFLEFAKIIRADFPHVPLLVTGGFRTREGMEAAVSENDCDMIGLGRPSVLQPSMPKSIILNRDIPDSDAHVYTEEIPTPWYMDIGVKAIGASRQDAWYVKKIHKMGS
ncbi:unnamed protein product [Clonostachys byssicola]|uniref:NADH:flavin oxidoreductase/NADH oxidase N-terminal domain-containing protein n=1 Tax=Clonostachys byssicola TaxID=160290 RepID=A0A9N9Y2G4_9HYPO|nr:unnamed protein product [Clonostachys byssicola]